MNLLWLVDNKCSSFVMFCFQFGPFGSIGRASRTYDPMDRCAVFKIRKIFKLSKVIGVQSPQVDEKAPPLPTLATPATQRTQSTSSASRVRFLSSPSTSTEPSASGQKAQKVTKVRPCERLVLNRGQEVLTKHGITHGQDFQSCHHANHCPSPSGHWNKFVMWVGEHELKYQNKQESVCSSCAACKKLLDRCHLVPDAPAKTLQDVEAADVMEISSSDDAEKPRAVLLLEAKTFAWRLGLGMKGLVCIPFFQKTRAGGRRCGRCHQRKPRKRLTKSRCNVGCAAPFLGHTEDPRTIGSCFMRTLTGIGWQWL